MDIIDPKSDLGFKSMLVDRPHIFIHLVNSLVPLPKRIIEVKFMNPEILPDKLNLKNSIVDACCMDSEKRHFMVEMQMAQQSNFIQRTLYNASKVYARQLPKNNRYKDLQPVYSINLLNHSLDNVTESWHHWYRLTHHEHFDMQLDDLNLIFFELQKWQKNNKFDINNPQDRWLQFFTNPKFYTMMSLEERKMFEEISDAVDILNVKKYSPEQLRTYDLFLDNIMIRESDLDNAEMKGISKGIEQGRELASEEIIQIITELKKMELTIEQIAEKFNTTQDKVARFKLLIF